MAWLLRRKRQNRDIADRLYAMVVDQARRPAFFTRFGVPDTIEGRFEMIVLHVFAVSHRLVRETDGDAELARGVTEAFVADIDHTLREMGVGDVSVGRKVKALYGAFGGRVAAYERAVVDKAPGETGRDGLAAALARNIYDSSSPAEVGENAKWLAEYALGLVEDLRGVPVASIRRSAFAFPDPEKIRSSDGPQ